MKQIRTNLLKVPRLHQGGKVILALTIFLLLTSVTLAKSGGSYDLSWWTVDGGGGRSAGGGYTLVGIAGQPDVGIPLSGGSYTFAGGFWGVGAPAPGPEFRPIYLPVVLKNS